MRAIDGGITQAPRRYRWWYRVAGQELQSKIITKSELERMRLAKWRITRGREKIKPHDGMIEELEGIPQ